MRRMWTLTILGLGLCVLSVRRFRCRHDWIRRTAGHRLYLECVKCGKESPGWHIDVKSPSATR